MSHFVVLVKLPSNIDLRETELDPQEVAHAEFLKQLNGEETSLTPRPVNVKPALAEILWPYKAYDGEWEGLKEYLEFDDVTEEYSDQYENETRTMVREADGNLYCVFDQRYKEGNAFDHKTVIPEDAEKVEIPFKELYPTFEKFMKDWVGMEPNEDGRFGYWHNPNSKWDWWVIGGRWSGSLPTKDGPVDIARVRDIRLDQSFLEAQQKVEIFKKEYQQLLDGTYVEDHPFSGPRQSALDLGMVDCKNEDEITYKERATHLLRKWPRQLKDGVDRYDVFKPLSELDEYAARCYYSSVVTYARLCKEEGWVQPGEMGKFGCSSATGESRADYFKTFLSWLESDPDAIVVAVDCHI